MKNLTILISIIVCVCVSQISVAEMTNSSAVKSIPIYRDCGSKTGTIESVKITDCDKPPCKFQRGKNYTLSLDFKSNTDTISLVNHVYGIIAHVPVPFHLPNDNACELGISCPIKSGDSLSESVTLPILNQYPKIGLIVKWVALDDSKDKMICFEFPVMIM